MFGRIKAGNIVLEIGGTINFYRIAGQVKVNLYGFNLSFRIYYVKIIVFIGSKTQDVTRSAER